MCVNSGGPLGVRSRKSHPEHIWSALPQTADKDVSCDYSQSDRKRERKSADVAVAGPDACRENMVLGLSAGPQALRPAPPEDLKMPADRKIARRALDLQARARDDALVLIPAYQEWSKRKSSEGESPALIANLDARAMWLLPEEVAGVNESDFEEISQT